MTGQRLTRHLTTWLGAWPAHEPLLVVGSPRREEPGWDGAVHPVIGVTTPQTGVLSVPPDVVARVSALLADGPAPAVRARVPAAAGYPGRPWTEGVFRWTGHPADLPDAGEWLPAADPSVPEWLRPFGGEVLVAVDPATGAHLSGVGIKRHDADGHELAVVTAPAAAGRGLARRLVAQAARRVLDEGAVPTYLHTRDNAGSARVAEAAGFADRGWSFLGVAE
jgi:GNAT superfamily N-acetyltransferase